MLDSLDQLSGDDGGLQLEWLPKTSSIYAYTLPRNVYIILSTLPEEQYICLPKLKVSSLTLIITQKTFPEESYSKNIVAM
jgi:hypothetical protein